MSAIRVDMRTVAISDSLTLTCPSEWFLGKAHANFHFAPKHKSNSYEIEAEG